MKIAIFSTTCPVPPKTIGGTERVVESLVNTLIKFGHNVTLFTSRDSTIEVRKIPISVNPDRDDYMDKLEENETSGRFDIIHDHSNEGLISPRRWERPYICTLHGFGHGEQKNTVCISERQKELLGLNSPVIYHGFDNFKIPSKSEKSNYLLWVGRIDRQKVPHIAIEVAKKSNLPLILAGPICDDGYFETMIKPELNNKIRWIRDVGSPQKESIFADAKAFIFPCDWEEPFGLVMMESLLAGTPVIAFDNGKNAVNEIIQSGKTGFICKSIDEMVESVSKLGELDNSQISTIISQKFNTEKMTTEYLNLYQEVIDGRKW